MKKVLFAVLLTFVMFLPNLSAEELKGTFSVTIPDSEGTPQIGNAQVSGTETTYEIQEAKLKWVEKDESIGRNVDGYWIGLKITAPNNYEKDKAKFKTTFYNGKSNEHNYKDVLDEPKESNIVTAWFNVTEGAKEALKGTESVEIIKYEFDWDGNGEIDQTLKVKILADKIDFGEVPSTHKTVTFESEKGTKTFTVENNSNLDKYLSKEEKEILNKFLAAPEGKELDRMYIEDGEEEKEFKLTDEITTDVTVKVLYKAKTPANPNTGDNIALYGFMGIISLLGLVLVTKFRKAN